MIMRCKNLVATITVLIFFGGALVVAPSIYATNSVTDDITIIVPASCTINTTVNNNHIATVEAGSYVDDIGEYTFKIMCNDADGFSVYAVGYTNDEFGNTTMKPSTIASTNAITTGLATSGDISNWAMKLASVSENFTITNDFNSYHLVPAGYTKVATYPSNTATTTGANIKSTYGAYISRTQPADTYTGKVKYTVVHPANELPQTESISQLTYMQDFKNLTAEQRTSVLNSMSYNTTYSLIDNRDNKTYQVAKLKDGNIWMAENLDLGKNTLTTDLNNANTNLLFTNTTITSTAFNSWIKSSGTRSFTTAELIPLTTSNTSDNLEIDSASNTPYGTLYNYCAISAGTICSGGGYNDYNATSDLCPAGWRLPTGGSSSEFKALSSLTDYNSPDKIRAPIANGGAAFGLSGHFESNTPVWQGKSASYWSSTKYDGGSEMYDMYISSDSTWIYYDGESSRYYGYPARCLAKKPSHLLTISYGEGVSTIQINGAPVSDGGTVELEEDSSYSIFMAPTTGYRFASWSTDSGTIDSVESPIITYTAGSSNATLMANASYIDAESMQNLPSSSCTVTASYAKDDRDGHVYVIQRLADGKCWMMENLDLGRTELITDLTSSNTNLTNTVTASTFNGWKKNSFSRTYTAGELIPANGADSYSKTPYGTHYNYCAISAGTICTESNSYNATSDLCPAGWRLPTGDRSGEFFRLSAEYNNAYKMRASITNGGAAFALAGCPSHQGTIGCYWSSTRYSDLSMYSSYILSTGYIEPSSTTYGYREYGLSARCVSDI